MAVKSSTKRKELSMSSYRRKCDVLGMKYGTARARLERQILFTFAKLVGQHICFRCGEAISSVEDFSIEHKDKWSTAPNPAEAFFDLTNIAFSHAMCNRIHGSQRGITHGASGFRYGCRCELCIAGRREYNRSWMADWREDGRNKSRRNYTKGR